jgi:hypothetical protein
MPTTTTPESVEGKNVVMLRAPTLQWALKRTVLAIVILFVTVATAASLLYASIDPEQEQGSPAYSAPAASDPAFSVGPTRETIAQSARRI